MRIPAPMSDSLDSMCVQGMGISAEGLLSYINAVWEVLVVKEDKTTCVALSNRVLNLRYIHMSPLQSNIYMWQNEMLPL